MGTPAPTAAGRAAVIQKIEQHRELRREWIRRQVLDHDRIDILAREALGLQVAPHHLRIAQHQYRYPDGNQILVFRGAGKTRIATVTKSIHGLLKNPNKRILVASKNQGNAAAMLTLMKACLELDTFERDGVELDGFRRIFGDLRGRKWDDVEFDVSTRTQKTQEANVTAVGVETAVASKHYDEIIGDDLVDEDNARTPGQRAKTETFFYKTLMPTLVPGGSLSVIGTFWHYADLYAHLQANEFAGERTLVIPAMTGSDEGGWKATWADGGYTVAELLKRRARMGTIAFDSQYLLRTDRMKGEIFDIDYIREVEDKDIPAGLPIFIGVDLAISQSKKADFFAWVAIAYDRVTDKVYVLDCYLGQKSFREQRAAIIAASREKKAEKTGVEATAYQEAQLQEIKAEAPDISVRPIYPKQDKITRGWKLSARFEDGKIVFRRGLRQLIDHLLEFPKGEHDDLFDALDHAITVVKVRERKPREEPGLF